MGSLRFGFQLLVASILALSGTFTAHAADAPVEVIVLTGAEGENPTSLNDGIEINYDPAALKDAPPIAVSLESLRLQSLDMLTAEYRERLRTEILVPISTLKPERLEYMNDFTPEQLEKLISRKTLFLERLAKTFRLVRIPMAVANQTLQAVNEAFFQNAKILMQANLHMTGVGFGISGGLGLSQLMTKYLRRIPLLKNLPDRTGFWMALSVGIAFTHTYENGWYRMKIEPFVEFRQAKKILMPFASIGAGVFIGQGMEAESKSPAWTTKFTKVGGFSLTHNEKAFTVASGLGVGLGWGILPVMQGEGKAFALGPDGMRRVYGMIRDAVNEIRADVRRQFIRNKQPRFTCSALFS